MPLSKLPREEFAQRIRRRLANAAFDRLTAEFDNLIRRCVGCIPST